MNRKNLVRTLAMVTHPKYEQEELLIKKEAFILVTRGLLELFTLLDLVKAEAREDSVHGALDKIAYIFEKIMVEDLRFKGAAEAYEEVRRMMPVIEPKFGMNEAAVHLWRALNDFHLAFNAHGKPDEKMELEFEKFQFCIDKILRDKISYEQVMGLWIKRLGERAESESVESDSSEQKEESDE